jgi:PAS domain S-box-containing protein
VMKALLSIRFIVPLLAAVIVISATTIDFFLIYNQINERKLQSIVESLKFSAIQTQGNINRALRRDDLVAAKQSLMDLNYLSLMSCAYLVDSELYVRQSTDLSKLGVSLSGLKVVDEQQLKAVLKTHLGVVSEDLEQHQAIAIYPVDTGHVSQDSRPEVWLLVVAFDYGKELRATVTEVLSASIQSALVTLSAFVLLSAALHILVTRRVFQIVSATNRYLSGEFSVRTRMSSGDELGLIGSAFDRIADAVEHSKDQLKDANFELEKNNHELRLRQLALDEHAIVSIANAQGVITYANQKFCDISQYHQSEVIGKTHAFLKSDEHDAEFFADLWNTITSGNVWQGNTKNRAKDGSFFWVASTIVPLVDPDTQSYRYIAIRTDITRQKRLNDELQETQVNNKRMYGIIAHELRTPVAAISMMAQNDVNQWVKNQASIDTAAQDLLHSIDDMKMLVNPELKRDMRLESTTVSDINNGVNAMVASAVAVTRMQYQQLTSLPEEMQNEPFTTDTYRVKAAVTNLVRNACLHSEGSKVWCVTSSEVDDEGQSLIRWTVGDDGKGIPESKVPNLFKPFERGDSRAEGTGLGLHIAKTWIEELGGSLIYRRTAQGSDFILSVPVKGKPSDQGATNSQVEQVEQVDEESLKKVASQLRLLFVEDDKLIQKVTTHVLKPLFAEITIANDGQEGLEMAADDYDLILTDYFMPNLTGAQMTAALRERGDQRPIIAATAATIGKEADELVESGADAVLSKPLNAQVVLKLLAEFIASDRFPRLN